MWNPFDGGDFGGDCDHGKKVDGAGIDGDATERVRYISYTLHKELHIWRPFHKHPRSVCTGLSKRAGPRLRELAPRGQREPGGGIQPKGAVA